MANRKWKFDTKKFAMALELSRGRKSLRKASSLMGISSATLYRLENGQLPDMTTFVKCCQYMDVELDYFVDHKGDL